MRIPSCSIILVGHGSSCGAIQVIRKDLEGRGTFYRTEGNAELLFFHKKERELYTLGTAEFCALCQVKR